MFEQRGAERERVRETVKNATWIGVYARVCLVFRNDRLGSRTN